MTDGITINLVCCTQVILNEIEQGITQKGISLTYAMTIKSEAQKADVPDWRAINDAIIEKWNMRALGRIKKRAWDIISGKVTP
jgi:hypothetical protein